MDEPMVNTEKWLQWVRAIQHQAEQPSQQFGAYLIAPVLAHGEEIVRHLMDKVEELEAENASLHAQLPDPSSKPSATHATGEIAIDALIAEMQEKNKNR